MKSNWALLATILVAASFAVSCNREDPIIFNPSIDGLWASSGCDMAGDSQKMFLVEITGTSARLVTLNLGKGLSSIYTDKEYTAAVIYKSNKGKGTFSVISDPNISYEFGLSKNSDKMYVRNESEKYMMSYYEGTLDDMVDDMVEALRPKVHNLPGFVGPTEYVELHAGDAPSLGKGDAPLTISESIWTWIAKGLVSGSSSQVAKLIIQGLIEDEESKKLDEILDQINVVNAQLAELINLVHNTTYEKYLNERTNSYLNPMRNLSEEYILRVEEAWLADPDSVGPIVIEWANRTVSGNPAYVEVKNFIDYLGSTVVEQKNLYQMYDMYVYNTHPWENLGYAVRENLRAGDLAVITQSLFLTRLYYSYGNFSDATRDQLCKDLEAAFLNYKQFYHDNPVVRHEDLAICQIKGAHFEMSTELVERDYRNHPWIPEYTPWEFENQECAWWMVNGDTKYNCAEIYEFCLSANEIKAIANYYKGSSYSNLLDVLTKDAKCVLPFSESQMSGKKIMMHMQTTGGNERVTTFEANYYIYARYAVEASKNFNIEQRNIGIAWLEGHGFLWMETWFRRWDTYYSDQLWFRTSVINRY